MYASLLGNETNNLAPIFCLQILKGVKYHVICRCAQKEICTDRRNIHNKAKRPRCVMKCDEYQRWGLD